MRRRIRAWPCLCGIVLVATLVQAGSWPVGGIPATLAGLPRHLGRSLSEPAGHPMAVVGQAAPWTMQAMLTSPSPGSLNAFGWSVALSGDTALVADDTEKNDSGAVYVFVRRNAQWVLQARLTASDAQSNALFGQSVALSGDTALVGAIGRNAAYVFVRSGTTWTQQAELTGAGGGVPGYFGWSVALSGDTALVGAYDESGPPYLGVAYAFVRSGTAWTQQAVIADPVANSSDAFAISVALYGNTVLIGAPLTTPVGVVYVFTRSGTAWTRQTTLTARGSTRGNLFGHTVLLSRDTALVTAEQSHGGIGAAYVFTRTPTAWIQQAVLTPPTGASVGQFGLSAALSGDTAVIGAASGSFLTGLAYVFARTGTTWAQQAMLTEPDSASTNQFGRQVALGGTTALVAGQVGDTGAGAAYVFVSSATP